VLPALHRLEGSLVLGHMTTDVLQAPPVGARPRHGEAPSASHSAAFGAVTALDAEASTISDSFRRRLATTHTRARYRLQGSTANHQ